jgi:hypothetical protein
MRFADLARLGREIEPLRLAPELKALDHARHEPTLQDGRRRHDDPYSDYSVNSYAYLTGIAPKNSHDIMANAERSCSITRGDELIDMITRHVFAASTSSPFCS